MARSVIFINTHPIQYFSPLYRFMNAHGVPTHVWYCSHENVNGHFDRQFGVKVAWDIPLLEGFPHSFFRNRSWKPSLYNGFFGLINPGLLWALITEKKSVIVIHGWAYFTHVMAAFVAQLRGHEVCVRGESPLNQELMRTPGALRIRSVLLRLLFRLYDRFLFIGTQNLEFYRYYGVPDGKLVFVPYSVDNDRFQAAARSLQPDAKLFRLSLGIPEDARVILFTAKFIQKKRPLDLLAAFRLLDHPGAYLVMVGSGELQTEMETYIREHNVHRVVLTGFVNQQEIERYYAIADVFVLCSGIGETWGLSVNEAMNFGVPIVVSDCSGCSTDLVIEGQTGFVFRTGDIHDLCRAIQKALHLVPGVHDVLHHFSFPAITESFNRITAE
jgi:glycosyltransferase involved in cell wall biosynthesis